MASSANIKEVKLPKNSKKKKKKKRNGTLKDKDYTTPLLREAEAEVEEKKVSNVPVRKPRLLRIFWLAWRLGGLFFWAVVYKLSRGRMSIHQISTKVKNCLGDLGGMWIKAGQVLSMRSDIFPMEFCNELAKLQDKAQVFSADQSKKIIEESIRPESMDEAFDQFEDTPFAAASLSQVHRARLRRKQKWVAVKVQRPFALDFFNYDMWWLARYVGFLEFVNFMPHMHWREMLQEIRYSMQEELDYRREGAEMQKFRQILKDHKVYVPKVYLRYSSNNVLVMEYLRGVFMSDYITTRRKDPDRVKQWQEENGIKPKRIARVLLHSLMRQIYEDLAFHGDLHPGNIVILKKNRIAFIDFGSTGRFDPEFAAQYAQYSHALATGCISRAADLYLVILGKLPVVDIDRLKLEIMGAMQRQQTRSHIKNLSFHERSMAASTSEMNQLITKHKLEINWNLLKIARTFAALDMNVGELNPKIDYIEETAYYHIEAEVRKAKDLNPFRKLKTIAGRISDVSDVMMPNLMRRALSFSGRVTHAIRTVAFVLRLGYRLVWVGLLVFAWVYIYQHWNSLVSSVHENDNWFTSIVESIPSLPKVAWFAIAAGIIYANFRFRNFIRSMVKPQPRLPGNTR